MGPGSIMPRLPDRKMAGRMPPDRIMSGSNDSATSRDAAKLETLPPFAVPAASRASEHPMRVVALRRRR